MHTLLQELSADDIARVAGGTELVRLLPITTPMPVWAPRPPPLPWYVLVQPEPVPWRQLPYGG